MKKRNKHSPMAGQEEAAGVSSRQGRPVGPGAGAGLAGDPEGSGSRAGPRGTSGNCLEPQREEPGTGAAVVRVQTLELNFQGIHLSLLCFLC